MINVQKHIPSLVTRLRGLICLLSLFIQVDPHVPTNVAYSGCGYCLDNGWTIGHIRKNKEDKEVPFGHHSKRHNLREERMQKMNDSIGWLVMQLF
jgi:hypothetical protein